MTHFVPRILQHFALITGLLALSACNTSAATQTPTTTPPTPAKVGAYATSQYRVPFQEWNPQLTQADLQAKLDAAWTHYFTGTDDHARLYFPDGTNFNGPKAYILDTGNNDVRTEGMSYGMMIAVQMNKKAELDAIWNWAYTHMLQTGGPQRGYFAWHTKTDGTKLDQNPAPDGEEYFATALLFASGRWGDGQGIYNYQGQANNVLNFMLHKTDIDPGSTSITNMFGPDNQVVFVPDTSNNTFTDTSYHVPAFYELFSKWAAGYKDQAADRQRWSTIANTSRTVQFPGAVDASTGLSPNYSNFDGSPHRAFNDDDARYGYDAWRVGMNWGVDASWFAKQPTETVWADRLQTFMEKEGIDTFHNVYTLGGLAQDTYHDTGQLGMIATAGLASQNPRRLKFVEALWNSGLATGQYRYYTGLLQFLALLNNAGQYRIYAPTQPYKPAPLPEAPVITPPPPLTQTLSFASFGASPATTTLQGASFYNYAYAEKPGDAVAQPVTKSTASMTIGGVEFSK